MAHIAALFVLVAINVFLIQFKNASDATKRLIRWTLAIILWTAEISWHIWNIYWGYWSDQFMLPLNVCSVLIWLSGFMLIFKNYRIYEFAYFLGITACANYLLTPDLGIYGFPTYRFIQTFISHGLVITSAIYMTVVEGFRPTWKSFWRSLGRDKCLHVCYILCQPRAWFQLRLSQCQTNDNQHPKLHAALALLHRLFRGDWHRNISFALPAVHDQRLAQRKKS